MGMTDFFRLRRFGVNIKFLFTKGLDVEKEKQIVSTMEKNLASWLKKGTVGHPERRDKQFARYDNPILASWIKKGTHPERFDEQFIYFADLISGINECERVRLCSFDLVKKCYNNEEVTMGMIDFFRLHLSGVNMKFLYTKSLEREQILSTMKKYLASWIKKGTFGHPERRDKQFDRYDDPILALCLKQRKQKKWKNERVRKQDNLSKTELSRFGKNMRLLFTKELEEQREKQIVRALEKKLASWLKTSRIGHPERRDKQLVRSEDSILGLMIKKDTMRTDFLVKSNMVEWKWKRLRGLKIHEYQGADLMRKHGINVPKGVAIGFLHEIKKTMSDLFANHSEVVVKAQIFSGGRELGTFKSGLQGGVHVVMADQVQDIVEKMLGQILVTKQTGPQGNLVNKVYLCEKLSLFNEMYLAIGYDRTFSGHVIIACKKGGTNIEYLIENHPELIVKVPVDVFTGITCQDAIKIVDGLSPQVANRNTAIEQTKKLYDFFCKYDCTFLEVNPFAETADNQLVAANIKLIFDDNSAFRQKEIFALLDPTQENPREVTAVQNGLTYIDLDGEIGCIVKGVGLAMATMDTIKLYGGTPAGCIDVDRSASTEELANPFEFRDVAEFMRTNKVVEAFKILTSDKKVKVIVVNFGVILGKSETISGLLNIAKQVQLKVPVYVCLKGRARIFNWDESKKEESGFIAAEDLDDAAKKAVRAVKRMAIFYPYFSDNCFYES